MSSVGVRMAGICYSSIGSHIVSVHTLPSLFLTVFVASPKHLADMVLLLQEAVMAPRNGLIFTRHAVLPELPEDLDVNGQRVHAVLATTAGGLSRLHISPAAAWSEQPVTLYPTVS